MVTVSHDTRAAPAVTARWCRARALIEFCAISSIFSESSFMRPPPLTCPEDSRSARPAPSALPRPAAQGSSIGNPGSAISQRRCASEETIRRLPRRSGCLPFQFGDPFRIANLDGRKVRLSPVIRPVRRGARLNRGRCARESPRRRMLPCQAAPPLPARRLVALTSRSHSSPTASSSGSDEQLTAEDFGAVA